MNFSDETEFRNQILNELRGTLDKIPTSSDYFTLQGKLEEAIKEARRIRDYSLGKDFEESEGK